MADEESSNPEVPESDGEQDDFENERDNTSLHDGIDGDDYDDDDDDDNDEAQRQAAVCPNGLYLCCISYSVYVMRLWLL
jgi:hypothetical protein